MPGRARTGLLRMLPLGLATAYCLWRRFRPGRQQLAAIPATEATLAIDSEQAIVHASTAAATLFGSTPEAMRSMPLEHFILRDLRSLDHDTPFLDLTQQLRLSGRRATDVTLMGRRMDGAMFPLEGSLMARSDHAGAIDTVLVRDISARKQLHEQLAHSFVQLRELSSALQTIREEERKHIARELHDDLGQLLATLRVDLTLACQHADMTAPLLGQLREMDGLLVTAISSLRRIASNLRPRALDEGGLYFALQSLRHNFLLRHAVHFELLADEGDLILDDERSTAIYRIVQEALTNIARHAEASRITIALHRIDSILAITIQDDGRGITDRDLEKAASLGLLGMRERVWGLNGSIQIGADNELGGTRIDIMLPMHGSAPPH